MDKYEYKVRSEEISNLIEKEKYAEAVKIADTIDWRRVKSAAMLLKIAALYRISRRNEDSREMLMLAYERYPTNRSVVYSLCELSIELDDVVAAIEYYKQFAKLAPKDNGVYTLRYRILEAQEASLEERIEILEELKKKDYQEEWAYELAYLYHRVGLSTKCVEECDDIILWFGDGPYVMKAMELKAKHVPLTAQQQQNYEIMLGNAGQNYSSGNYDTQEYNSDNYNEQDYGTEGYTGEDYTGQNYTGEDYTGQNYNDPAYAGQNYHAESYDGQDYNPGNYEEQGYAEGYDDQNYGAQNYDGQNYSAQNYNDQNYDAQNYNGQNYGAQNYEQQNYDPVNYHGQGYDSKEEAYADEFYGNDYGQAGYADASYGNGYGQDGYPEESYSQQNYSDGQYVDDSYAQNHLVDDGYGNLSYVDGAYQDNGCTGEFYVEQTYDENGNPVSPETYADGDYMQGGTSQDDPYAGQTDAPKQYRNGLHLVENTAAPAGNSGDMSQYNTINLQKVVAESMKELFPDDNDDVFAEDRAKYNSGEEMKSPSLGDTRIFAGVANPNAAKKKEGAAGQTGRMNIAQMVTGVQETAPEPHTGAIKKVFVPGEDARSIKSDSDLEELRDTTEKSVDDEHSRMEYNDENVYHDQSIMRARESDETTQPTGPMKLDDVLVKWERMKQDNARKHQEEIKKRVLTQTGKIFADFDHSIKSGILGELEREEEEAQRRIQAGPSRSSSDGFLDADVTGDIPQQPASDDAFDVAYQTGQKPPKKLQEPGVSTEQAEIYIADSTEESAAGAQQQETALVGDEDDAYTQKIPTEDIEQFEPEETEDIYPDTYPKEAEAYAEETYPEETETYAEEAYPKEAEVYAEETYPEETETYPEDTYPKEAEAYAEETYPEEIETYPEEVYPEETETYAEEVYPEETETYAEETYPEETETYAEETYPEEAETYTKQAKEYTRGAKEAYPEDTYVEEETYIEDTYVEEAYNEGAYTEQTDTADFGGNTDDQEYIGSVYAESDRAYNEDRYAETDEGYTGELYEETGEYTSEILDEEDRYHREDPGVYEDMSYIEDNYEDENYAQAPVRRQNYQYNEKDLDPEDAESIAEMAKEDALKTQEIKMNTADLSSLSEKIVATTKKEASGARREEIRDFTPEEQTLFENFAVTKKIKKQIIYALENMTLAAYTGNVIITGDAGLDTVRMAKNLVKEYQVSDESFSGKLAKITGEKINQRNIKDVFEKLNNGGIIIEKANGMSEEKLYELATLLSQDTFGIVVIMEDTKKEITKLLEKQAMIVDYFNIRIDLMEMDNNALVAYAKNYALALEYSIDELGTLALYTRIANMQSGNHVVTKDEVRDIIDEAIWKSKKSKIKNFVDVLFARRYDNEDMIVLKERDFM